MTNQQDVVRNERRQSIENSPYGIVEEGVFHMLFPKSHPYHADVMGSHADIQAAKLEDVRNFFKLYYAPNNASPPSLAISIRRRPKSGWKNTLGRSSAVRLCRKLQP